MKVGRSLRGTRAAVFAVACVSVSAAGHIWMSGAAVPAWALLLALLATGGAGYVLAGRQRGFASIAGLMLAGELILHLLFTAAQNAAGDGPMNAMPSMPGMSNTAGMTSMPGMVMQQPMPTTACLCGPGGTALGGGGVVGGGVVGGGARTSLSSMGWMSAHHSIGMIAVHAVAGLLCAWWLACGEAAAFRLLRAFAQFALPLLVIAWRALPAVPDLTARVPDDRQDRTPTGWRLLVHAVVRRGPPARVFSM